MKLILASLALSLVLATPAFADDDAFRPTRHVNVNGVRIAVYESEGCGPDVLMVHGNTSEARSFEKIFDSSLAKHFHLVALDLPGFGNSENAPTYSADVFATAIAEVAHRTGTDDGVLVGWSLGGDLALQSVSKLPNLKGLFIFGTAPVGADPTLPPPFLTPEESYGAAVNYGLIPDLTNAQIKDYVRAFFRPDYDAIPNFFFRFGKRTDPATRAALFAAATGQDPTFQDEVAIVRDLDIPIAIVLGDTDAFVNPAQLFALAPSIPLLWQDEIILVQNSGHAIQWEHAHRFEKLLRQFVNDVQ